MTRMDIQIANRITGLPKHFFSNLVHQAEQKALEGIDIIDLGRGSPDLPTPPHIVEALKRAADDPATHRYPLFTGLPELKEAIAEFYKKEFDVDLAPEKEVAILYGSKTGVVELPQCILNPGDICLLPDPGYPDYLSGVHLAQAETYFMPLRAESDFYPDLNEIPADVLKKAKLMFLNYPNNPTTTTGNRAFFEEVVRFAKENHIMVAHDFAYGSIVFDGKKAPSFLSVPGAKEVGIEFYSLSKTYNMAGWRVGFALGNEKIIAAINTIQNHYYAGLFTAIQRAAVTALTSSQRCVEELVEVYQRRRDRFVHILQAGGIEVIKPSATFFVWIKVPNGLSSESFANRLLNHYGVVVAPGIGFGKYGEGYIRASLLADEERLAEAAQRMIRAI